MRGCWVGLMRVLAVCALGGCVSSGSSDRSVAVQFANSSEGYGYSLHPTSIYEIKRRLNTERESAVFAYHQVRMGFSGMPDVVAFAGGKIDKWNTTQEKVAQLEIKDYEDAMHSGDYLFAFEYEIGDHVEIGILILTPDGRIRKRFLEAAGEGKGGR